jgi:hypothetical protein
VSYNLKPTNVDPCVYVSKVQPCLICTIFVDDGLIYNDKNINQTDDMINKMKSEFEITITNAYVYVELHIHWDCTQWKLWISQALYVSQILKRFEFEHATPINTPIDPNVHLEHSLVDETFDGLFSYSQVVGCLMFAHIGNRLDISCVVSTS